jgi:hypothetical protein
MGYYVSLQSHKSPVMVKHCFHLFHNNVLDILHHSVTSTPVSTTQAISFINSNVVSEERTALGPAVLGLWSHLSWQLNRLDLDTPFNSLRLISISHLTKYLNISTPMALILLKARLNLKDHDFPTHDFHTCYSDTNLTTYLIPFEGACYGATYRGS